MNTGEHRQKFELSDGLFLVYFLAWLYLVITHIGGMELQQAINIFMNAFIIALFVGFGLNVNAYRAHAKKYGYRTLHQVIDYIREHIGHVLAFYIIPFAVSSASGLVAAGEDSSLVRVLFGTESYSLICVSGFAVFILLPALYVLYRHGWN